MKQSFEKRKQERLSNPIFAQISELADRLSLETYVVGGYVRDIFLDRTSKDIDVVTVGSGIRLAEALAAELGKKAHLSVFKSYGTAQVKYKGVEVEFVGARRESYQRNSRNPIVEDGTLDDDQKRRDFTINALAICLNRERWGEVVDPFGGVQDLDRQRIVTPMDPDITFSDDPLRMLRAVRFASRLGFEIDPVTFDSIYRNRNRIEIVSKERILDELNKIILSEAPVEGFTLLDDCGLLELLLPELTALKGVDSKDGRGHKDNFRHSLTVLENIKPYTQEVRKPKEEKEQDEFRNLWLRWSALFHDIGKPATKRWEKPQGWTFHNHNYIGMKMLTPLFKRMKMPLGPPLKFVQKMVELHMRPIALVEDVVTDSAVRRLIFEAGNDIELLMTLCEADITSKNEVKVRRYLENFKLVRLKIVEIEEKDHVRNFQPPVSGDEIMSWFGLSPCSTVGELKSALKEAILDGNVPNEREAGVRFIEQKAQEMGLNRVV